MTYGPGDEVHQLFGHTGIEVYDPETKRRHVFDFGIFNFSPNMLQQFVMGRLWFSSGVHDSNRLIKSYKQKDRDVYASPLNIPADKKRMLMKKLLDAIHPDNRVYLYHHYYNNCATRILDILDEVFDGKLKPQLQSPSDLSLREHTRRHAAQHGILDYLMSFAMNNRVDKLATLEDAAFLPEELRISLESLKYTNAQGQIEPLIIAPEQIYTSKSRPSVPEVPPLRWPFLLSIGGILGILLAWSDPKRHRWIWGGAHFLTALIVGIPGCLLLFMALATDHELTYYNHSLFLANPLTLITGLLGLGTALGASKLFVWVKWGWRSICFLAICSLLLELIPSLRQDTHLTWALVGPILLGGGLSVQIWSSKTSTSRDAV